MIRTCGSNSFREDDCFRLPKANLEVLLRTPLVNTTPRAAIIMRMYTELVHDSLSAYLYNAEIAGLHYGLCAQENGLRVTLRGNNDRMLALLEKILISMRNLQVDQARFRMVKERLLQELRSFDYVEPFKQVVHYRAWLNGQMRWANHDLLAELPRVSEQDIREFLPPVLGQFHIEILVHGNLSEEEALRSAHIVEAVLQPHTLPESQWDLPRSFVMPPGTDLLYQHILCDRNNVNQCVEYTIQVGDAQDRSTQAKLLLFAQVVHEPLFDKLRTKEQLGYICSGRPIWNGTQASYRILVQSDKNCRYVEDRIVAFLEGFEESVTCISQSEFEAQKISAISKRLKKLQTLEQATARMWHHITNGTFDFGISKATIHP